MKILTVLLIALLSILCIHPVFAQSDTIIVYNVAKKTIDTLQPVKYDTSILFDKTNSHIGTLGNKVELSTTPPTTNLINQTQFSDIARADQFFDIEKYPVRTAIRLVYYRNGKRRGACSGIMVGRNMVLTAAHCVCDILDKSFKYDSLEIIPGYNNGNINPLLPTSFVEKIYFPKMYYDNGYSDIALLQLQEPVGEKIGWIGMAFTLDPFYFDNKVLHKFSYPAVPNPDDTTQKFNGDTLYYNYGFIDKLDKNSIGLKSPYSYGIPGQSGSSLFYTDNYDYITFGVLTWSHQYYHFQITNSVFYQFKNIIENNTTIITNDYSNIDDWIIISPNPFTSQTTILIKKKTPYVDIDIFTIHGIQIKTIKHLTNDNIILDCENLPKGVYIVRIMYDGKTTYSGKIHITE